MNQNKTVTSGKKKTCIVLVGPTAVGKTAVAIQLAQQYNTAVISADSRQCFKEMTIGVAKPSTEQLQSVPHYFINSHTVTEEVNARIFEAYALKKAEELFLSKDVIIVAGGTGLYINAFCNGMDEIPDIDVAVRNKIIEGYKTNGINWLQKQVKDEDPVYFGSGEIHNPQRLMRALEVKLSTGKSIRSFQTKHKAERDFNIIKIGLELPKEQLHRNIHHRVDSMLQDGLIEEVKSLINYRHLNALQTVGYKEIFEWLDGKTSLEKAVEDIKKNTRHYAKRQMTWFRKDTNTKWFSMDDIVSLVSLLDAGI